LLPGPVRSNQWAVDLVHPVFAQKHDFLGFPLSRPTAPFVFTNEWGSGVALLTPMVFAAYASLNARWRSATILIGFASLIPIVMSVNRGLWLALVVGLGYGAVVLAARGDTKYFQAMFGGAMLVALIFALTPLGGLIGDRIENGHSDEGRLFVYGQVIDQIQDSPWVGYGAPRVNVERPNLPSVGTHGQFWTVLYSHGIPGAIAFVGYALHLAVTTLRRQDRAGIWLHVTVALVPILMWFYELINQPIFLMFIAGALALRGVPADEPPERQTVDPRFAASTSTLPPNRPTGSRRPVRI
jgi:O-antigen ligase